MKMKTNIRLKKDGVVLTTNRVRFLRTLEVQECKKKNKNLKKVRTLAKDADEISWMGDDKKVLHFLYEEDREFPEEHAKCEAKRVTMKVLQAFWEEARDDEK